MVKLETRFRWRAFTSVLMTASFVMLVVSGFMLFVSPPGRIANWTNWTLLQLTKREWLGLHVCFRSLFLIASVLHIVFNWRPLTNYFKGRLSRRLAFRLEWILALALCGLVFIGTQQGWTPFASLLALGEQVKESWDRPAARAPIPHAELLTLAELARQGGIPLATATNNLAARGILEVAPDSQVQAVADRHGLSAQQLYEAMLANPVAERGGPGFGQGRNGPGGGAGGGPGRKTLAQFCADEGIELAAALEALEAKGIKATAEQTLREIANQNGQDRPYQLLEIIRGN